MVQPAVKQAHRRDYHVQALERALGIVEELAKGTGEVRGAELAERLHLHLSTADRVLAVLEKQRIVERNPANVRYRLGWRLFELGMVAASRLDLYDRAKPQLERLAEETGETAHIGVLREGEIISLLNVEGQRSVRIPGTVGRHAPLHCTSKSKAILAFCARKRVEALIRHHLLVRRRGYAVDNEEFEIGLRCVGAPVRGHTGEVIAAISIAGPSFRMCGQRITRIEPLCDSSCRSPFRRHGVQAATGSTGIGEWWATLRPMFGTRTSVLLGFGGMICT